MFELSNGKRKVNGPVDVNSFGCMLADKALKITTLTK